MASPDPSAGRLSPAVAPDDRKTRILDALEDLGTAFFEECGVRVRKVNEDGTFTGLCPLHDDQNNPSFSAHRKTGRWGWICFTGCGGGNLIDLYMARHGKSFGEAMGELGERFGIEKPAKQGSKGKRGRRPKDAKIVAAYDYVDEDGVLLYQHLRWAWEEDGVPCKDFSFRRPDPEEEGGWIWDMNGVERVPYRLPDLIAAEAVFLLEGEKDVEALVPWLRKGMAATTIDGTSSWSPEYAKRFKGKRVVQIPDNDEAGEKCVHMRAPSLIEEAMSYQILRVPLEESGSDLADWIATGLTKKEFYRYLQDDREEYQPRPEPEPAPAPMFDEEGPPPMPPPEFAEAGAARQRVLIEWGGEPAKDPEDAVTHFMQRGPHPGYPQLDTVLNGIRAAWYVVEGESGRGKSTFVNSIVHGTIDRGILDENRDEQPFPWLVIALEDSRRAWETMILSRLSGVNSQLLATKPFAELPIGAQGKVRGVWSEYRRIVGQMMWPVSELDGISLYDVLQMIEQFQAAVGGEPGAGRGGAVIDPVHSLLRNRPGQEEYDFLELATVAIRNAQRRWEVPIITTVHLNRKGEAKGSSGFEFRADVRLRLEEGEGAKRQNERLGKEEIKSGITCVDLAVLKNKNMRADITLIFRYDRSTSHFSELS